MSNSIDPMGMVALAPLSTSTGSGKSREGSWYEAMATAWGQTLDRKAADLESISGRIIEGDDKPATVTMLSTQAMQMGFLSTSSHSTITSAGEALKTMAQKN
ncbi:MAG: hypothetical protein IIZ92_05410 [Aquincola sp.]|uniref:hypothetical protein n=1 Tax=uncultured Aquincola sp. TaxID=886556 RepID=UPI0032B2D6AA|nr:hypothetical protein [Aquincola sp.]|tara:strand:- start:392 stop:697 length:306 start_codon:yes stop_codon:yes gene_type:complete